MLHHWSKKPAAETLKIRKDLGAVVVVVIVVVVTVAMAVDGPLQTDYCQKL